MVHNDPSRDVLIMHIIDKQNTYTNATTRLLAKQIFCFFYNPFLAVQGVPDYSATRPSHQEQIGPPGMGLGITERL